MVSSFTLRIHQQVIHPDILAFREQWFSSPEAQEELQRRKKNIPVQYELVDKANLTTVSPKLAEVNLSAFRPEWEDADTLLLKQPWWKPWKKSSAIRLTGIDAPEISHPGDPTQWFRFQQEQPGGRASLQAVKEWTTGKNLRVFIGTGEGQQTYGRHVGIVTAGEQVVNLEALRRGWAAALPFGESGSDLIPRDYLMRTEKRAIAENQGMWQDPYFQKYLDVSRGLGGRITFNTFSDLTRLARNFHLASAESYMREGERNPGLGRYIGRRLVPSYGRFFSGHNSAYNTIEGLRHEGFKGPMRRINTDFGSGYLRSMYGSMKTFLSTNKKQIVKDLVTDVRSEFKVLQSPSGRFASRLRISINPQGNLQATKIIQGQRADINQIYQRVMSHVGHKEQITTGVENTFIMHEASEGYYSETLFNKILQKHPNVSQKQVIDIFNKEKAAHKISTHASPAVIAEEALFSAKMGPRSFEEMRAFRRAEFEGFRTKLSDPKQIESFENYNARVSKIYDTVEKNWLKRIFSEEEYSIWSAWKNKHSDLTTSLKKSSQEASSTVIKSSVEQQKKKDVIPYLLAGTLGIAGLGTVAFTGSRFSADHGDYNTLPGMQHGGIAAEMRRENTDFGSRSDPLRAIARGLGQSFEEMTSSKAWKTALEGGKLVRELNQGAFAKVSLYETTFAGQQMQFVKKEILPHAEELVRELQLGTKQFADPSMTPEIAKKALNLAHEAGVYQKIGHTPVIPSFYGGAAKKGEALYMQYMPGLQISEMTASGTKTFRMPAQAVAEVEESMHAAAKLGIRNLDIHGGNVLWDPVEKRAAWIDWAAVEFGFARDAQDMAKKMGEKLANVPGIIKSRKVLRPAEAISPPSGGARIQKMVSSEKVKRGVRSAVSVAQDQQRRELGRAKMVQMAEDLGRAQTAIWEAVNHGGSSHITRPAQQAVEQISPAGGTAILRRKPRR